MDNAAYNEEFCDMTRSTFSTIHERDKYSPSPPMSDLGSGGVVVDRHKCYVNPLVSYCDSYPAPPIPTISGQLSHAAAVKIKSVSSTLSAPTPAKLTRTPLLRSWKLHFIQKDRSTKRRLIVLYLVLAFAVALIVATGILVIYLTVFGNGGNDFQLPQHQYAIDPDSDSGDIIISGRFRIKNREYNRDSPENSQLGDEIQEEMHRIFQSSYLLSKDYNFTKIVRLRSGSILVDCIVGLRQAPSSSDDDLAWSLYKSSGHPPNSADPGNHHWRPAERVGVAFLRGLTRRHSHLWLGNKFVIDEQFVAFTEISRPIARPEQRVQQLTSEESTAADDVSEGVTRNLIPSWSEWSSWSGCHCNKSSGPTTETRTRTCHLQWGATREPLTSIEPCLLHAGQPRTGDLEARECHCVLPTTEAPVHDPCENCQGVCVALVGEPGPTCRAAVDVRDPTGCGGHCRLSVERCRRLLPNASRCVPVDPSATAYNYYYHEQSTDHEANPNNFSVGYTIGSGCLTGEWRCGTQLCISFDKRCDGSINCYDKSDEENCECDLTTHFHCSGGKSCLALEKKCNGLVDCFDGSDEYNCTQTCVQISDFPCADGRGCIRKEWFCDGFSDCPDGSDEPKGCRGQCQHYERTCGNGRCILQTKRCDGTDDCGDGSDEQNCIL